MISNEIALLFFFFAIIAGNLLVSAVAQALVQAVFVVSSKTNLKFIRGWMITWGISTPVVVWTILFASRHVIIIANVRIVEGSNVTFFMLFVSFFISLPVGFFQFRKSQARINNP